MFRRAAIPLLFAVLAGACTTLPEGATTASLPRPPSPDSQVNAALATAARQVRRCYRAPRVSFEGRQIITRLRVRFSPQGELAGLPRVLWQAGVTPSNQAFAPRMAEAAIAAVIRCAPVRLPQTLYRDGWSEFDLTFSPLAAA